MSSVLLRYTYTCSDGERIQDDWREIEQGDPTVCRNNTTHTIAGIPLVMERIDPAEVTVKEMQTPTGSASYAFDTIEFTATANSTTVGEEGWEDDINVLSFTYVTTAEHTGDTFTAMIGEDSEVCPPATDVAPNDTVIVIPSSMFLPYLSRGNKLKITDTKNTNDLGFIRNVNYANCSITVQTGAANAFSSSDSKLLITRIFAGRTGPIEIGPAWSYTIGKDKIGSSYVPAGKKVKIEYTNKSDKDKRFVVIVRYMY